MKKHLKSVLIAAGIGLVLAGILGGCATPQPEASPTEMPQNISTESPELVGDPVRGGLLYDEWWAVPAAGEEAGGHEEGEEEHMAEGPTTDQPLWKTQTTNTRTGADTWRCKECHGWDYKGVDGAYGSGSHTTGFVGVFNARGKPAAELLAVLKGSTNPDHDFSSVMEVQDLIDLALFMSQDLVDADNFLNPDNTSQGNAAEGKGKFDEVCGYCHGPEGNAINFASLAEPEFIGHLAKDNPWEFLHKVRFGQPGWPMPSAITNEWTDQDVANVLAYAQSLPTTSAVSWGGQLYDKWWEMLGLEGPTADQPLWKTQTTNTLTGADTWRCKECHGWDYKGVEGAYGSGSHMTGFKGISGAASMSTEELTAWLTGKSNPDHDYSAVLDEAAINALVTFVQKETFDSTPYINADKTANGEPARGQVKFEKTCAACHGLDGMKMNFGSAEEPEFVGTIAVDNPWEFFHKASFGHPGAPMPAGLALGYSLEDIANLLAYAQTLPVK